MPDNSIISYNPEMMRSMILDFNRFSVGQANAFLECAINQELMTLLLNLRKEFPELKSIVDNKLSQIGYIK